MAQPIDPHAVAMLAMRGALHIEITTGLKHSRGSVLQRVNDVLGVNIRTKRKALCVLENVIEAQFGPLEKRYSERSVK